MGDGGLHYYRAVRVSPGDRQRAVMALLVCVLLAAAMVWLMGAALYAFERSRCEARANKMQMRWSYSLMEGCMYRDPYLKRWWRLP